MVERYSHHGHPAHSVTLLVAFEHQNHHISLVTSNRKVQMTSRPYPRYEFRGCPEQLPTCIGLNVTVTAPQPTSPHTLPSTCNEQTCIHPVALLNALARAAFCIGVSSIPQ